MRQCDRFFEILARSGLAVTYDEVRLRTRYSEVSPAEVSLTSQFSRRVSLNVPIVSAAMDTVTESRLAIELAKLGGLGVLHRSLSPVDQRDEARRVKFNLSGLIANPITVREGMTMAEVEKMRKERNFPFHSLPVLNAVATLTGLLTQNDFDFCHDLSWQVSEVMTRELVTAKPNTTMDEAYDMMRREKKKVLPLVNPDGSLAGMYLLSDLKRIKSGLSDMYNMDRLGRLRVAAAIGVGKEALERVELLKEWVDVVVIDTAHGDSGSVFQTLREIKNAVDIDVVVGNISEGGAAKRLVDCGADGIKVGQGPGSICTTRVVAGIGCPQVTAIYNVAQALEGTDVPICADGGIEHSGDIPIAIGAGAHSVMLGKLFAGTREAPGEVEFRLGRPMKHYRGMGSVGAMEASQSARERYQQKNTPAAKLVPEGIEGVVPYVGELAVVTFQYLGGLRSGMGYLGAKTIEELRQNADFYRITTAGLRESHPHGIQIIEEAPNYRRRGEV